MNQHSFVFTKSGKPRSKCAGNRKRNRSSKKIVEAVLDDSNNTEQQMLAQREAMLHKDLRSICVSAGLILDSSFLADQYLIRNIKNVIKLLIETNNKTGRTTNDKRGLLFNQ